MSDLQTAFEEVRYTTYGKQKALVFFLCFFFFFLGGGGGAGHYKVMVGCMFLVLRLTPVMPKRYPSHTSASQGATCHNVEGPTDHLAGRRALRGVRAETLREAGRSLPSGRKNRMTEKTLP